MFQAFNVVWNIIQYFRSNKELKSHETDFIWFRNLVFSRVLYVLVGIFSIYFHTVYKIVLKLNVDWLFLNTSIWNMFFVLYHINIIRLSIILGNPENYKSWGNFKDQFHVKDPNHAVWTSFEADIQRKPTTRPWISRFEPNLIV